MKNLLSKYNNGNYTVEIYDDGTKIRETEEETFEASFPENIDIKITNKCLNNCDFCFLPNSKIINSDGNKTNIQDIKIGDKVKSYNFTNNEIDVKQVDQLFKREYSGKVITIQSKNKSITVTPNHKIYTLNRGFVKAEELTLEDELQLL